MRLPSAAGTPPSLPMSRVTLQTIADQLGVSRMTVSNAFSRPDQLSAALRERILATAEQLGYSGPDAAARALRSGTTGAVGIVLTDSAITAFTDEVATRFFGAIATELAPTGLALTLVPAVELDGRVPARDVPMDAALLYHCDPSSPAATWLVKRNLPIVYVDQFPRDGATCINVADRAGARAAAEHLVELGHRHVAAITFSVRPATGVTDPSPVDSDGFGSSERLRGWSEGLATAGITPPTYRTNDTTPAGARIALDQLLAVDPQLTAVLCFSDVMATSVVEAAAERGLRVPGDLSVVGFDDTPFAAHTRPRLTTVHQDVLEKGRLAARAVIALLDDPDSPVEHVVLPTSLVIRDSTALPRS